MEKSHDRLVQKWKYVNNTKFFPLHAMKAYGGSGSLPPLILNLGAWYGLLVNITPQPLYPREKTPVAFE